MLGKIDPPLDKKLSKVEWGEFKLSDIFTLQSYQKRFDANKVNILSSGKYPYIVRTAHNNGQRGFIEEDVAYLNDENTISFGQDTATAFYQKQPYFTGDKIKVLKAKDKRFNRSNALINAIKKLTLRNVADYADKRIAATKEVIQNKKENSTETINNNSTSNDENYNKKGI